MARSRVLSRKSIQVVPALEARRMSKICKGSPRSLKADVPGSSNRCSSSNADPTCKIVVNMLPLVVWPR